MTLFRALSAFFRDTSGNAIANVVWVIAVIGFGGVGVDTSNAFRMKTMMQATADAGALGGVVELAFADKIPRAAPMAQAMVDLNMPPALYGELTTSADIAVGRWIPSMRQINVGAAEPDAIMVTVRRNEDRENQLFTSLLAVTGFKSWDISVASVARVSWRKCVEFDGLMAAGTVNIRSVNTFYDNYCIYGEDGVLMNNNNDFTGEVNSALVGTGNAAWESFGCEGIYLNAQSDDPCDFSKNPGLEDAMFHSNLVGPGRVNADFYAYMTEVGEILQGSRLPETGLRYAEKDWRGNGQVIEETILTNMLTPQDEFRAYYFDCKKDTSKLKLPRGDYANLLIATNCMIEIDGGAAGNHSSWSNVTVISTSDSKFPGITQPPNKGVNISVAGGNRLGESCENGVRFMTTRSIAFAGDNRYRGVEITAVQDLILGGHQQSYLDDTGSMTAHVGGNAYITSSGAFRRCETGNPYTPVRIRSALVY